MNDDRVKLQMESLLRRDMSARDNGLDFTKWQDHEATGGVVFIIEKWESEWKALSTPYCCYDHAAEALYHLTVSPDYGSSLPFRMACWEWVGHRWWPIELLIHAQHVAGAN